MEKLSMRKIREVLRLKFELDLSDRQISKSTQVSRPTISDYVRRFAVSGLSWPLPAEMSEADIDARLFSARSVLPDVLHGTVNYMINGSLRGVVRRN